MPSIALSRWACVCSQPFLIAEGRSSNLGGGVLPFRQGFRGCKEFCRTGLVESNLGHELGETRVGAQGVGHGIDIQVDEPVDAFLEGEVE